MFAEGFLEDFQLISDEEKAECQRQVASGGVEGCMNYLRQKEGEWKTLPLNIGVIGNSGVGKSSVIKAMRRLTADDEGAAAVGVTETTTDIRAYTRILTIHYSSFGICQESEHRISRKMSTWVALDLISLISSCCFPLQDSLKTMHGLAKK